jgi:hypothetical protein
MTPAKINSTDETVVELSKTKILLAFLGAAVFVAVGVYWLSLDEDSIRSQRGFGLLFNNPTYVYAVGIMAIVLFGFLGLLALTKLFNRKPGLVFNNVGIVDNASSLSVGLIPWSDVVGWEIFEIQSQKLLIIKVNDPEKYFERGNSLKRSLNKGGFDGNPIGISSITLKISFAELTDLLDQYQRKYGNT